MLFNQLTNNENEPPFTLDVAMKKLESLSRGLRGGGGDSKDVDTVGILSQVKDIAESYSSSMQVIQKHYRDGDKEKAGAALKAAVGDTRSLIESSKENEAMKNDLGLPSIDGITPDETNPLSTLGDVPNDQVGAFIQPEVFDQFLNLMGDLRDVLGPAIAASKHYKEEKEQRGSSKQPNQDFKFDSNPFESQFDGGQQPHFYQSDGQSFRPQDFLKYQHNSGQFHTDFASTSGLGKFSNLFENDEVIMAKHQLRQNALGEEVCGQTCNAIDWECHCGNLFDCVGKMSEYDLAGM